ncbi:hypothetical protein PhCBS80983_g05525 [Powellomyces hirtus]|uniref:40S ribosomal protein S18 n=1 Tax=Powellomyces hirtus TaxID=109895 RepID=A0A507DVH2_9FUNG|nr:hypothetical protein PhCBS80983_g05525 [Powellomyces hirtus]
MVEIEDRNYDSGHQYCEPQFGQSYRAEEGLKAARSMQGGPLRKCAAWSPNCNRNSIAVFGHCIDEAAIWETGSSITVPDKGQFQHILRLLNTNVDGRRKVMYAMTHIKGVGRRYANIVCKKADIDLNKRAGELTNEELERVVVILQNPRQYKIPDWFLNRQKDVKDGKFSQVVANSLDNKLREDLERLKKIRAHRGLRHYWGVRVRGQHTKTTGRRGKTVGVAKKKG